MSFSFELVTDYLCSCGECPLWDERGKRLFWIDVVSGDINCYYPLSCQLKQFHAGQKIGSIGLGKSGKIIAALKTGIFNIDFPNAMINKIFDPEPDKQDNRFNDGKCDPAGRFWVGSMSDKGEAERGSLYTLEKNGKISKKLDRLSISNGLAWDIGSKKFYHIDSLTSKIVVYDYCNESGNISNGTSIIDIDGRLGAPDGMTIDEEGMLWVAHWNGGRVTRWNPKTAKKLQELFLPVSKVTSCTFGGENLEDLYITTARIGLTDQEISEQPLAGATFVVKKVGVRGVSNTLVIDDNFESFSA
jgi:sugar lactone lactonase YvrE